MLKDLLFLALGGMSGTLCRFGLTKLTHWFLGYGFPWGTFAVNCLGCLLFGLIATLAETRLHLSVHMKLMILTGFLGAFTTFSTYAFESDQLLSGEKWMQGVMNIFAHNVVGLALLLLGIGLGRYWS